MATVDGPGFSAGALLHQPAMNLAYRPYMELRPGQHLTRVPPSGMKAGPESGLLLVATDSRVATDAEKALYAALRRGRAGGEETLELKASVVTGC